MPCHALRGLLALLLPDQLQDALQLIRHAEAYVLPRESELAGGVVHGRVVGGIVESPQALGGVLAEAPLLIECDAARKDFTNSARSVENWRSRSSSNRAPLPARRPATGEYRSRTAGRFRRGTAGSRRRSGRIAFSSAASSRCFETRKKVFVGVGFDLLGRDLAGVAHGREPDVSSKKRCRRCCARDRRRGPECGRWAVVTRAVAAPLRRRETGKEWLVLP